MALFQKSKKTAATASPEEKKVKAAKTDEKTGEALVGAGTSASTSVEVMPVLVSSPRVSEKAAMLAAEGTYVFNVPLLTNKIEVRKAVEKYYKVHVVRVNMLRGEGKRVSRGRISGQRSDWKKALVTLKKGEKIELHKGV